MKPIISIFTLTLLVSATISASEPLELSCPDLEDGGEFPIRFTCDGEGISPSISWSGVPEAAKSLVVIMDHMPDAKPKPKPPHKDTQENPPPKPKKPAGKDNKPEGLHWYWTMYNIPVALSGVEAGESAGTLGSNSVNHKNEYAPPCSAGPGPKSYTIHLYALSDSLHIAPTGEVTEAVLRENIRGLVIDSTSLSASVERGCTPPPPPPREQAGKPKTDGNPPPKPQCEPAVNNDDKSSSIEEANE